MTCPTCPNQISLRQAVHAASEMAQSRLGIRVASRAAIAERLGACQACPHGVESARRPGVVVRCSICRCWVREKVRRRGESCPDDRWGPEAG